MSLNSLFGIGKGRNIYITVSQACGLEVAEIDANGEIKSYAQSPLEYNEIQREIANLNEFQRELETLFSKRDINPAKANIYLSMPVVWFGYKSGLPLLLDDPAIQNIVLGELEQTFIFKRKDPIPQWFDALASQNSDSRSIFYTAIQQDVVDAIKEIFTAMGANLVYVGSSILADLKGLLATGIAAAEIQENRSWSLMLVNNSGFQLYNLQGNRIIEFYEEPLPLKTYEDDEVYTAIEEAAQIALMSTPSSSLVVISETDLISAEILAGRMHFSGDVLFVEDNKFRKAPIMDMGLNVLSDDQIKVSLHMIGHLVPSDTLPIDINFVAENKPKVEMAVIDTPFGKLTPPMAMVGALVVGGVIAGLLGGVYTITNSNISKLQQQSADLDAQITQLNEQIGQFNKEDGKPEFDSVGEIEKVLKSNRMKVLAYTALGETIPKNIYLTYFMTGQDGIIDIRGCADSVEEVYVFFKNLQDSLVDSKLRLSQLDLRAGSLDSIVNSTSSTIDDAPYVFEITNMDASQLKAFIGKLTGQEVKEETSNDDDADKAESEKGKKGKLRINSKQRSNKSENAENAENNTETNNN